VAAAFDNLVSHLKHIDNDDEIDNDVGSEVEDEEDDDDNGWGCEIMPDFGSLRRMLLRVFVRLQYKSEATSAATTPDTPTTSLRIPAGFDVDALCTGNFF